MNVRVRFAPSPTGPFHIGSARSVLFNFLFAKHEGGGFVLRIEDTDKERSQKKYEAEIFESLAWLGIAPDEGPSQGGNSGPYRQSERTALYSAKLRELLGKGLAFYCPHETPDEGGKPVAHWCSERDGKSKTEGAIIRFKTPQGRETAFKDLIRGEIKINTDVIGDFSIAKDLETPLYNFAAVVDDEAMRISHVLRGEEHIANTPKQMLLAEALGFKMPQYAHLPLVLGSDRSKLSKRHGPTSLTEFKERGYLPEALVNFLALLGWNPGGEQEIFSMEELVHQFSLEKVHSAGAIFDFTKLDWMNGEYIHKMSVSKLADLVSPFMDDAGLDANSIPREKLEKITALEQPRLKRLAEIGERMRFYFEAPSVSKDLLVWKNMNDDDLKNSLNASINIMSKSGEFPSRNEIEKSFLDKAGEYPDKGRLLWPLRSALTGLAASPGPFDIIGILGRDESISRLKRALSLF